MALAFDANAPPDRQIDQLRGFLEAEIKSWRDGFLKVGASSGAETTEQLRAEITRTQRALEEGVSGWLTALDKESRLRDELATWKLARLSAIAALQARAAELERSREEAIEPLAARMDQWRSDVEAAVQQTLKRAQQALKREVKAQREKTEQWKEACERERARYQAAVAHNEQVDRETARARDAALRDVPKALTGLRRGNHVTGEAGEALLTQLEEHFAALQTSLSATSAAVDADIAKKSYELHESKSEIARLQSELEASRSALQSTSQQLWAQEAARKTAVAQLARVQAMQAAAEPASKQRVQAGSADQRVAQLERELEEFRSTMKERIAHERDLARHVSWDARSKQAVEAMKQHWLEQLRLLKRRVERSGVAVSSTPAASRKSSRAADTLPPVAMAKQLEQHAFSLRAQLTKQIDSVAQQVRRNSGGEGSSIDETMRLQADLARVTAQLEQERSRLRSLRSRMAELQKQKRSSSTDITSPGSDASFRTARTDVSDEAPGQMDEGDDVSEAPPVVGAAERVAIKLAKMDELRTMLAADRALADDLARREESARRDAASVPDKVAAMKNADVLNSRVSELEKAVALDRKRLCKLEQEQSSLTEYIAELQEEQPARQEELIGARRREGELMHKLRKLRQRIADEESSLRYCSLQRNLIVVSDQLRRTHQREATMTKQLETMRSSICKQVESLQHAAASSEHERQTSAALEAELSRRTRALSEELAAVRSAHTAQIQQLQADADRNSAAGRDAAALRTSVESLKAEKDDLVRQLSRAHEQIERVRSEAARERSNNTDKLTALRRELDSKLRHGSEELRARITHLEVERDNADSALKLAQDDLSRRNLQISELRSKYEQVIESAFSVRQELEQSQVQIASRKAEVALLRTQLNDATDRAERAESQLGSLAQVQQQLDDALSMLSERRKEVDGLRDQLAAAQHELRVSEGQVQQQRVRADSAASEATKQMQQQREDMKRLHQRLADSSDAVTAGTEVEAVVAKLQQEVIALHEKLSDVRTKTVPREELDGVQRMLDQADARIAELTAQLEQVQRDRDTLASDSQAEVKRLEAQVSELRHQMASLPPRAPAELDATASPVARVATELPRAVQSLPNLARLRLSDVKDATAEQLRKQVLELRAALDASLAECDEQCDALIRVQGELDETRAQLASSSSSGKQQQVVAFAAAQDVQLRSAPAAPAANRVEQLEDLLSRRNAELNAMQADLAAAEDRIAQLQADPSAPAHATQSSPTLLTRARITELEEALARRSAELDELQRDYAAAEQRAAAAATAPTPAPQTDAELRADLAEREAECQDLCERLVEAQNKVAQLQQSGANTVQDQDTQQAAQIEREAAQARQACTKQAAELETARRQIAEMRERLDAAEASAARVDALQQRLDAAEAAARQQQQRLVEAEAAAGRCSELQQRLDDAEAAAALADELQRRLSDADHGANVQTSQQVQELQRRLSAAEASAARRLDDMQRRANAAELEAERAAAEVQRMSQDLRRSQEHASRLASSVPPSPVSPAASGSGEAEARQRITLLEVELRHASERASELDLALTRAASTETQLREQISRLDGDGREQSIKAATAEAELRLLRQRVTELEAAARAAQERVAHLEVAAASHTGELQRVRDQEAGVVRELQRDLDAVRTARDQASRDLSDMQRQRDNARDELERVRLQMASAPATPTAAMVPADALAEQQQRAAELAQRNRDLEAGVDEMTQAMVEMKAQLADASQLRSENQRLTQRIDALRDRAGQLEASEIALIKQREALESGVEASALREQLESLQQQHAAAQEQVVQLQLRSGELEEQMTLAKQEHEELVQVRDELAELRHKCDVVREEAEDATNRAARVEELETTIVALNQRIARLQSDLKASAELAPVNRQIDDEVASLSRDVLALESEEDVTMKQLRLEVLRLRRQLDQPADRGIDVGIQTDEVVTVGVTPRGRKISLTRRSSRKDTRSASISTSTSASAAKTEPAAAAPAPAPAAKKPLPPTPDERQLMQEMRQRIRELEASGAKPQPLVSEVDRLTSELNHAKTTLGKFEQYNTEATEQVEELAAQLIRVRADLDTANEELNAVRARYAMLREQHSKAAEQAAVPEAAANAGVAELRALLAQATRERDDAMSSASEMEEEHRRTVNELGSVRMQLSNTSSQLDAAQSECETLKHALGSSATELDDLRRERDDLLAKVSDEMLTVQDDKQQAEGLLEKVTAELAQLQRKHDALVSAHTSVTDAQEALQQRVQQLEQEREAAAATAAATAAAASETEDQLRHERDEALQRMHDLSESVRSNAEELQVALESDEQKRASLESENERLRAEMSALVKQIESLSSKQTNMQLQFAKQRSASLGHLADGLSELAAVKAERDELISSLDTAKGAIVESERAADAMQRERDDLRKAMNDATAAVQDMQRDLDDVICERDNVQRQLRDAEAERDAALAKAENAPARPTAATDDAATMLAETDRLREQVQSLMRERQELRDHVDTAELTAARANALNVLAEEGEAELQRLTRELDAANDKLQTVSAERASLRTQLIEAKAVHERRRKQLEDAVASLAEAKAKQQASRDALAELDVLREQRDADKQVIENLKRTAQEAAASASSDSLAELEDMLRSAERERDDALAEVALLAERLASPPPCVKCAELRAEAAELREEVEALTQHAEQALMQAPKPEDAPCSMCAELRAQLALPCARCDDLGDQIAELQRKLANLTDSAGAEDQSERASECVVCASLRAERDELRSRVDWLDSQRIGHEAERARLTDELNEALRQLEVTSRSGSGSARASPTARMSELQEQLERLEEENESLRRASERVAVSREKEKEMAFVRNTSNSVPTSPVVSSLRHRVLKMQQQDDANNAMQQELSDLVCSNATRLRDLQQSDGIGHEALQEQMLELATRLEQQKEQQARLRSEKQSLVAELDSVLSSMTRSGAATRSTASLRSGTPPRRPLLSRSASQDSLVSTMSSISITSTFLNQALVEPATAGPDDDASPVMLPQLPDAAADAPVDPALLAEFEELILRCSSRAGVPRVQSTAFMRRVLREDVQPSLLVIEDARTRKAVLASCAAGTVEIVEVTVPISPTGVGCFACTRVTSCTHRYRSSTSAPWQPLCRLCCHRITSVSNFYQFVRLLTRRALIGSPKELFHHASHLRTRICLARVGIISLPDTLALPNTDA